MAAYRNSHNTSHVVNNVTTASQLSDIRRQTDAAAATDHATHAAQVATIDRQIAMIESAGRNRGGQRDSQGDSD